MPFVRRRVKAGFNNVSQGDVVSVVDKHVKKEKVLPTDTVLDPYVADSNNPLFIQDVKLQDLAFRFPKSEYEKARVARGIPEFQMPEAVDEEGAATTVDADE